MDNQITVTAKSMAANLTTLKPHPRSPQEIAFDEWDEKQLENALQKLKGLHVKLRDLRSTIPKMVRPLTAEPALPPEVLNTTCQESLMAGIREVQSFKESITAEDSKRALEHATRSRRRNGKNIKPWKPRDELDWANI